MSRQRYDDSCRESPSDDDDDDDDDDHGSLSTVNVGDPPNSLKLVYDLRFPEF